MNRKIVVIDGMARSGTTLLSSLIHSQADSVCYRGVFHEFLACDIGEWKKDYALYRQLDNSDKIIFKKRKRKFYKYLSMLTKNLYLQSDRLANQTLKAINKKKQTGKLDLKKWEDVIYNSKLSSMNDLDSLYQEIARLNDASVFAMRWNQGLPYIRKFLRKDNNYWVSIIRNPMDRAISDYKVFGESYNKALMYTDNYGKILDETKNIKNHILVYFEDLVTNVKQELKRIYNCLSLSPETFNLDLKQQSGEEYRVESSDLIAHGKNHTYGEKFIGLDKSKIGKWKQELNQEYIDKFSYILNKHQVYKRYADS
jgi:hypothetical protein